MKSNYFEEDLIELYLFKSNLNDLINYFFIQTESLVCLYKKKGNWREKIYFIVLKGSRNPFSIKKSLATESVW